MSSPDNTSEPTLAGPRQEFVAGVRDTVPLVIGAIPFGIVYGALAITSGLSPWAAMGMSLFVFGGASQFVAAGLIAKGTGVLLVIATTFIVNLRHGLYGASLSPFVTHLSQRWLLPMAFWLTDETYAVTIQRYQKDDSVRHKHWYYLGSGAFMYGNWQLCTLIGIVSGQRFQQLSDWGLEFAMVVTFVGIVVPLLVNAPMVLCALVSGLVAVLARDVPHQLGLMIGAMAGMASGLMAKRWRDSRTGAQ